jgi:AcrR family transcriptional regulator
MSPRGYRLGRRQGEIDRTRSAILSAARELIAEHGPSTGMGKVAERAGVSRITVYNQFGSKEGLLDALAAGMSPGSAVTPPVEAGSNPLDELRLRIARACTGWSADPALYRRLEAHSRWKSEESDHNRALAESLTAHDQLRPGCSMKEAADVIGILTSFAAFDRLHLGGRRSPAAVAEILMRMAGEFLT